MPALISSRVRVVCPLLAALSCIVFTAFNGSAGATEALNAESLTTEQARALVARYKGSHLLLKRLSKLNVETATALAAFNRDDLHLDGLTTVDCDTARALAGCLCSGLHLSGVTQLDAEAARAKARRVTVGLERFRDVTIDFTGVDLVGQGFCDEVFRVFADSQPHIVLAPVGMNESVAFMVERARRRADAPPDKTGQPPA